MRRAALCLLFLIPGCGLGLDLDPPDDAGTRRDGMVQRDARAGRCSSDGACDDDDPCTVDTCDRGSRECRFTVMVGARCDDGDPCTDNDTCQGGGECAGADLCPPDDDPCTYFDCDGLGSCTPVPVDDGTSCDDDIACTFDGVCVAGVCERGPDDCGPIMVDMCMDGLSCDYDSETCEPIINDGDSCDDLDVCTVSDVCGADGSCTGSDACASVPSVECAPLVCAPDTMTADGYHCDPDPDPLTGTPCTLPGPVGAPGICADGICTCALGTSDCDDSPGCECSGVCDRDGGTDTCMTISCSTAGVFCPAPYLCCPSLGRCIEREQVRLCPAPGP